MTRRSIKVLTSGLVALFSFSGAVCHSAQTALAMKLAAGAELDASAAESVVDRIGNLTLHDTVRNKDLQCRVTFPKRAAVPCPIVIFSHGALGSKDGYDYLVDYLSARGYVCIQPTHADSLSLVPKMERLLVMGKIMHQLPHDAVGWDNRARDISFIIDSLPLFQQRLPVTLNINMIACAGHSLGAFTTALISGAEPPPPATRKDYLDKRVTVAIMFSPQGVRHSDNDFGFADKVAWRNISVPCLFFTGTLDNTKWTNYQDRRTSFTACPSENKYFAVEDGAAHMTFAGHGNGVLVGDTEEEGSQAKPFRRFLTKQLSKSMTPAQEGIAGMLDDICKVTACFLDAYLKQNSQAADALHAPHFFGDRVNITCRQAK